MDAQTYFFNEKLKNTIQMDFRHHNRNIFDNMLFITGKHSKISVNKIKQKNQGTNQDKSRHSRGTAEEQSRR